MNKEKILYADELMVDDWVTLKETDGDWPSSNCKLIFKDLIRIDDGGLDATAIPLTDEILEKNGFIKERECGGTFKIKDGLDLVHSSMFSMHSYEFCGSDNMNSACTGIYVDYVHELQHILKQCDINKEIII